MKFIRIYINVVIFKRIFCLIICYRHIASRQNQYAVSVLLLSRGAKVGKVNAMGETAVDCCRAAGDTMNALRLNYTVNQQSEHMTERTVRILTKYVFMLI